MKFGRDFRRPPKAFRCEGKGSARFGIGGLEKRPRGCKYHGAGVIRSFPVVCSPK